MPRASNHVTLVRQWEILRKLPARGPGITAGEILRYLRDHRGYLVTKRTVERDLVLLSGLFGIRCNHDSVPYGWHWLPGSGQELAGPDLSDSVSIIVAEQTLRTLLPGTMLAALEPKFALARNRLRATEGNRYGRWAHRVRYVPAGAPLLPPKLNSVILAKVHEGLMLGRQLCASYLAPNARRAMELTLHPLGLVQRASTPYLIAAAFGYTDVRLYAVHRFRSADVLNEPVVAPKGFDLDEYLTAGAMHFSSGRSIRLQAWVSSELGIQLAETPLALDQSISPEGHGYRVKATVSDSWQIRWWILSQGDSVRIAAPKALRQEISETLAAALRGYTTSI